jgi:hypothetical protein
MDFQEAGTFVPDVLVNTEDMTRYTMEETTMIKTVIGTCMLVAALLLSAAIALAEVASKDERARMSVEVANYIHDTREPAFAAGSFHGTTAVEIGAAVIEMPGALADWRAANGAGHGQVAFLYVCDHWNVLKISNGVPLRPDQIVVKQPFPITRPMANKLVAELGQLDTSNVAFLKPAKAHQGC